ncbi:vegetative incompatibility protein HET-E-1 [Penicillium malachiteum]|uniref:vegetative incompatibility protein HET-E-1 n=1 Tax=Penicillium malachiteum TaxID=1324776 RepID=UPI002547F131|nr:vegetative incompatibility protein HET-E-1 [Penicillium malachiteum]KAJ5715553.1 vegetative incompatibility protein HET-E-1 [Penicillium malachiteum]
MAARSPETHTPYINVQSVSASNDANIQIGFMSHEKDSLETSLAKLPIAFEAAFNSKHNQSEALCLLNTRLELLDSISIWIEHDNEKTVFWLTGMAGTGKSTVARTGGGDLNNGNKLVTTLAWRLAIRIPLTKRHVCDAVRTNEDITTLSLHDQWERLIINSLSQISSQSSSTIILFVIDALDECDSEGDIWIILKFLTTSKLSANIRLKIFITSRPHVAIRGKKIIKRLVEIAYGLFIWASTACRFIREDKRFAIKRLKKLIHSHRVSKGPEKQLDQIYTTVLQESIEQGTEDDGEREELYSMLREVLGSVLILCAPLSMESLSSLLGIPPQDIKDTLADLHTVLNIPRSMAQTMRLHHPTFRDSHKEFSERCVDSMSKHLKRNICELKSPGTFVKDIEPTQIEQHIPLDLQHCQQGGIHLRDGDKLHKFFQEFFLYWLEAVNLMGKGDEMGAIIRLYHALLKPADNRRQLAFAKDARRFIFKFQNIIKQAPLQVYCAALVFIQPTNELKIIFGI